MSALGRISGPLLKANLLRNGVNLAFENDLLYLDVVNQRIGIKTDSPQHELDVNGTTRTTDLIVDNCAYIADVKICGNTIETTEPYLNLGTFDTVVGLNRLTVDSIDIEGNAITTNDSNADLELRPNGTGTVEVHSDLNVHGNATIDGNITVGGNINIGDADTDDVSFNADVASDIIPDLDNTYKLGNSSQRWADVWVGTLHAGQINSTDLSLGNVDLAFEYDNIIYVAENGDDSNVGKHIQDPVGTIKYALSLATSGDTVFVYPGVYTEEFPLTVPAGVTIKGHSLRSVKIVPTNETRYNDAFLLNGQSTVEDLTIADFYSGKKLYEVTQIDSPTVFRINVGVAPFAHTYVSGGTITADDSSSLIANITNAVYDHTTGEVVITTDVAHDTYQGANLYFSGLIFSCNGGNRVFPDNGYAFRFATDFEVTSRSPYIRNISVITQGSVTSALDPRGFDAGDAGKGAYIDGAYATANSIEATMLFHSATFITPGVDAITMTNGVRVEWLNSFTYFANRSLYAFDSNDGLAGAGKTRIKLSGVGGTPFAAGDVVRFTSTDASTVTDVTVDDVDGNTLIVNGKNTDLLGSDYTPQSIVAISGSGATATTIENIDIKDFGAEVRLIASASVYGNQGLVGDGEGVLMYAIGHNLAYIGTGKEYTNEADAVDQDAEVIETNGAVIRYTSVDHKGDFRVGDLFYVNQEDGTVDFAVSDFTINTTDGVTFVTGGDTTFVDGTKIETGDWRISGNTIETLTQDANFDSASGEINLNGNVNVTGNLDVTGNVTVGGNITIGDEASDTIQIVAGIDSDLIPSTDSAYALGTTSLRWKNLYVNQIDIDDIQIRDNYITTTVSNSNLDLRANGTGQIYVPDNNVVIDNDLQVTGQTTLGDTEITGNITINGDTTQSGDVTITGSVEINQDLTVDGIVQFEEIKIDDNYITTTSSNTDLELRASGIGKILVPNNDVEITNVLTVSDDIAASNVTVSGQITADSFTDGDILIDDNVITTTLSNSDLELRANGTGEILVPSNNVQVDNNLTVSGDTDLQDTTVTGTITHTGNVAQTGNSTLTGNLDVTGNVTISGVTQFEDIKVETNFITTTRSNADLELRAAGTGDILIPNNDVTISNDLTVAGTISVGDVTSLGTITANRFSTGDILIDDNFITTTTSNSNLELRANGTGEVIVPSNDVIVEQDLTVNGTTTLSDTVINGDVTHTGNTTQTGDYTLVGTLDITGDVTLAGSVEFEDIKISGNVLETTLSNSDLELRAAGTGEIIIPENDVNVTGNLTVDGTINVGNVVSTGLVEANTFSTGDILVDDNYITTTISNSNLELRAAGTGSIIIDTFDINGSTITTSGDLTLEPGSELVNINATGSVKLPVGDTSERPTGVAGQIRYNSDLSRFEGFNGSTWINLKGVEDLDGDTNVTAELTEGANDDIIRFNIAGTTVVDIDANRLNAPKVTVDDIEVDGNVISTVTSDTDLVLTANGTGSVTFDNFAFKDNTITNTVSDSVTTFVATDAGYVKFDGTYGMVIPSGKNTERPPIANTEIGQTRWNTDASRVEVFDGSNWVSAAGSASGISRADAEELAFEIVLSLG